MLSWYENCILVKVVYTYANAWFIIPVEMRTLGPFIVWETFLKKVLRLSPSFNSSGNILSLGNWAYLERGLI